MNFKKNTLFENIWLISATLVVTICSLITGNNPLVIISSICGVIYCICIAYEDKYAYCFGLVNVVLYGIVCISTAIYAGAVYNLIYSAPMMIYGFIIWNKKDKQKEITVRELSNKKRLIFLGALILGFVICGFILQALGGTLVWLDSLTTCVGFIGIYLMTNKYIEQWWAWNVSNLVNSILWLVRTIEDISNFPLLIMWLIYLANSIYALIKWNKIMHTKKLMIINSQKIEDD